jgi:hypothetical protein
VEKRKKHVLLVGAFSMVLIFFRKFCILPQMAVIAGGRIPRAEIVDLVLTSSIVNKM